MKSVSKRLGSIALVALALPLSAQAVVISQQFAFTENRGPIAGFASGQFLVVGANSITPSGGTTTVTATHVPSGSGPDFAVPFTSAPALPNLYSSVTPYAGQTGQWIIGAVDGVTAPASALTHVLDDPKLIPLVTGLSVSGPLLTPHVTWDSVDPSLFPTGCGNPGGGSPFPDCAVGFDFYNYQVEIRIVTGIPGNPRPLIFTSGGISTGFVPPGGLLTPTPGVFDVPAGILSIGQNYHLGIRLNATELEFINGTFPGGPFTFTSNLENRSTAYLAYSTAVPEPNTLLLVFLALSAMIGTRFRARAPAAPARRATRR